MSQPSENELANLALVAQEMREVFAYRGHGIGTALDVDECFRDGELGRSALGRLMAKSAARVGAGKTGISCEPAAGGALNLRSIDGMVDRRYRLRKAKALPDGSYLIEANSDSIMELDGDSFWREERWVFAYTVNEDDQLDDIFVAEILEVVEGNPGHLVLGPVIQLQPVTPPTDGFSPRKENDLPGFEEGDEGAGEATDAG